MICCFNLKCYSIKHSLSFLKPFHPISHPRCKKKKNYTKKKRRRCIVALQTEDIKNKELHYMTKKVMNDSGKALPVEGNYGQSLDVPMKENRHIRSWKC